MRIKDEQIVAQSQLKLALDFLTQKKVDFSLTELMATTNILIDYVSNGWSKELGEKVQNCDNYLAEKTLESKLMNQEVEKTK